jgi:hypothetical protein
VGGTPPECTQRMLGSPELSKLILHVATSP